MYKIKSVGTPPWISAGAEKTVQSRHMNHPDHQVTTKTATSQTASLSLKTLKVIKRRYKLIRAEEKIAN